MGPLSQKTDGWESRLAASVQTGLQTPFEWSVHDCATWAFSVRAALTGQDATLGWKGQYTSLRDGLRLLRAHGLDGYRDMGIAILGDPLPSVLLAQRGDIALGPRGGFGVVLGRDVIGISPTGPVTVDLGLCVSGWRV